MIDQHGTYCPKTLLMGLYFLKGYATQTINAMVWFVSKDTYHFYLWKSVNDLANLSVLDFHSRITELNRYHMVRMTVDGTDFRINEPYPFNPMWYSHKFSGPGVRYKVVVGLREEGILWVNGPFPCGGWPDLRIARAGLVHVLQPGERVIADSGYRGDDHFLTPTGLNDQFSRVTAVFRARHESVNGRLKTFNVLSCTFRHGLDKHKICFLAVVNMVQISIITDSPLFVPTFD